MKGQSFFSRLRFAGAGLRTAMQRERSFRLQLAAATALLAMLLLTRPPPVWWAIFALAAALVLTAELLNSALEALADRVHPERHPEIRVAKDLAAAAVLVASLAAVLVAAAFMLG